VETDVNVRSVDIHVMFFVRRTQFYAIFVVCERQSYSKQQLANSKIILSALISQKYIKAAFKN